MLDFQPKRASKNFLAGKERRRLLILVFVVGLSLILVNQVRLAGGIAAVLGRPRAAGDEVDTRVRGPAPGQLADVFHAPAGEPTADPAPAEGFFPGVNPAYLGRVKDDTFFRSAEQDAWFHLLKLLQETDPARIAANSTGEAAFVQLYEQPAQYRGQLVSMAGTVRRASYERAPANKYGIEGYFKLWFFPSRGPNNPLLLFSLELPDDFPIGSDLGEDIEFTGFFFKRWIYEAGDGLRTTPVLLARSPQWQQRPANALRDGFHVRIGSAHIPLTALAAVTIGLMIAAVAILARLGRTASAPRVRTSAPPPPESLAAAEAPADPRELLKRLEEEA